MVQDGDFPAWIFGNVRRAVTLGLHEGPSRSILDIGCGAGHFLAVCDELGHKSIGIDVHYSLLPDIAKIYGLDRRIEQVLRGRPIAQKEFKFDLVTAIWTQFDIVEVRSDHSRVYWTTKDWSYFLDDLVGNHVKEGGSIHIELNKRVDANGFNFTDFDLLHWFYSRGAGVNYEKAIVRFETIVEGSSISKATRKAPPQIRG